MSNCCNCEDLTVLLMQCPVCNSLEMVKVVKITRAVDKFSTYYVKCDGCQGRTEEHPEMLDAVTEWNNK